MQENPTYQDLLNQIAELKKQNDILITNSKSELEEKSNLQIEFKKAIEKRDKIQEELIEKSKFAANIIESSALSTWVSDSEGTAIMANKACLDYFGGTKDQVIGKYNLFKDEEIIKKGVLKTIQNVFEKGQIANFIVDYDSSQIGNIDIENPTHKVSNAIYTPILDSNGKVVNVIIQVIDITEIKRAENKLKIAKEKAENNELKLRELNATKDKLFSIIAHDLRSPFNNILGFSNLIIENNCDPLTSKKYAAIINTTTKNTLILLDNLLNWAKQQTGELRFNPEKVFLSEIIEQIIAFNSSNAKSKNIAINYMSTHNIELYTDTNILKTVLRNLISNAIKFTELNGNIHISATLNKNVIEVSISDNGVGMSQEIKDKLFDISTNKTSLGTLNEKGSGLGLVLCKQFIEKLGGKIWVESEEGKGSDFKFTLPLRNSN